jgi:hypothetical protein
VCLNQNSLKNFCTLIATQKLKAPVFDTDYHFNDGSERTVMYLFLLDSLNFCFWGNPRWEIAYEGEKLSGYVAMAAALKRAVSENSALLDPKYLASMTFSDLAQILHGSGELQLMPERLEIVREIGSVLLKKYKGQAYSLVEAAQGSALKLVNLVTRDFRSFRDETLYKNHKVFFYKRAQIFVADLYAAFSGQKWGTFHDLDQLTAFADYKLPQVLRHLDILQYSAILAKKIDHQEELKPSSLEEIEIRAHTLWAVELIRRELESIDYRLRAYEIDWLLWHLGQDDNYREKPYHRTRTIYY